LWHYCHNILLQLIGNEDDLYEKRVSDRSDLKFKRGNCRFFAIIKILPKLQICFDITIPALNCQSKILTPT